MSVEMRFTKWGGKRHWHYQLEPLGTDEHGWWLGGAPGLIMQRGDEDPFPGRYGVVALVPESGDWIAHWNAGKSRHEIYIDVTDRPVRSPDAIEVVDLDLDVVRLRDGTVEVLDEDEFEEHQRLYRYPPEVIAGARAATDDLV
ncbi:MAG: DUF402 domain-containing protein, partial [Actinoplanes sp.]